MYLIKDDKNEYVTTDQCTAEEEKTGLLKPVFKNGHILYETSLSEIRERIKQ
jgi:nicotinamide phosphoribosyltransferase